MYKILTLKIMMKKIVLTFLIIFTLVGICNANECNTVINGTDWLPIITKNRSFDYILPKKAFEKAVENLQIFCCKMEKEETYNYCNQEMKDKVGGPSSTYLLDHILDVSLRRLDAKEKNENWDNLIYGLEPDTMGKERRSFITKNGNSTQWSVPLNIVNKYKKYWSISNDDRVLAKFNANSTLPRNEKDFENYQYRTLKEKYNWVCESSMFIYINKVGDNGKLDPNKLYDAYNKCKKLVNKRIANEYEYTNTIISQKWWVLLHTNISSYLKYISQDKILELQQLIFNIKTLFAEVNKAVPELTPKCK